MTDKTDLVGLPLADLEALFASWGEKRFRAKQVHKWLHERGATSFDAMTDLPKALRERLEQEATLTGLAVAREQTSRDGTVKRLYRLADGQLVETVLMPYKDGRRTACISSQAGCAMGCVFCATGQMGFKRHLTAAEIFGQVWRAHAECRARGERLSNVVLMGMGEPLHNYGPVLEAVRRMQADLGIGARHITLSTVGLAPQIRRFADEGLQVTLAISLHAADDATRRALMPVNKRYPLDELLDAVRYYVERTKRRVTFEWALIEGENDTPERAAELGRLLRGLPCHVNLIPLNPTGGYAGRPSDPERVAAFVQGLADHGIPATVRVRRGIDIDAGCGQLRERYLDV
ncbi:MAG: 23S rRNA (adenine(2503)-C(2))-methyltransferase RlmN [Alphaproteobacteria bacterium]|nr:23S rRNA (adenine(2503)-C(2))-methyltransferase RlmN [Alphaproteobacteria bacterium]MCB9691074.1 23S rRNA (adenine(2503)-C(2))-methyltransferase RlmN [Alphaproteobacteria bacterium]